MNMPTVYVWRFSAIQVMSVSSVPKVSLRCFASHSRRFFSSELKNVKLCSSLCCVGVRLPRRVIGSCSMMRIVAAAMLRQAQYRTLDKSAVKLQGFSTEKCLAESNLVWACPWDPWPTVVFLLPSGGDSSFIFAVKHLRRETDFKLRVYSSTVTS